MSSWFRTYGFAEILPGLLIGAYPLDGDDVKMLDWLGIQRILNLCEDREYAAGQREAVQAALTAKEIEEARICLQDFGGLPSVYLEQAVEQINSWLDADARIYVHCRAGWQRSATVAAAVVCVREHLDPDGAIAFVQRAKPTAEPLPHQREDLERWFYDRPTGGGEVAPQRADATAPDPAGAPIPQPADAEP